MIKDNKQLFSEDLMFLDMDLKNKSELFEFVYKELYKRKIVKKSFLKSITDRENKYSTGLPTKPYSVAIPHCNPENVNAETVSIIRFKNKIKFLEMGKENELECKFAFVITMKGVRQVSILSDLMILFKNEKLMLSMLDANKSQLFEIINKLYEGEKKK